MMGLACEESGFGTSAFAVKRNNLYGWNAVDSNPDKATAFNSKEEATLFVASKLKANYLTEGGAYHEGYSARSIDIHYCTDKAHADKIVNVVNDLIKKLG
jgi:beta-N-acetylglucosaminidase